MARHLAPAPVADPPHAEARPEVCPQACAPGAHPLCHRVCPGPAGLERRRGPVTIGEVIAAAEAGPGWDAVAAARATGSIREGLALARLAAGLRERGLYPCAVDVA